MTYLTKRIRATQKGETTYEGNACPIHKTRTRHVENMVCVTCAEEGNTRYSRNREDRLAKAKEYQKTWRRAYPERAMLSGVKSTALMKHLAFDLTIDDINIPELCPVLGLPMDRRDRDHTPSVDRRDNSKGYVKGNIRIISNRANRLKGEASIDEVRAILAYMVEDQAA